MTVENCIALLKAYEKQMKDPTNEKGVPLKGDHRAQVISQSKHNYEQMKAHILKSKKFLGGTVQMEDPKNPRFRQFERHPIVDELLGTKKEPKKKEVKKEDGKKSKR